MTFRVSSSLARRWRRIRHAAMLLASLVVAHEAVYLVRYGSATRAGAAMTRDGHDAHWPLFLVAAAGAAVFLGGWSLWRLTVGARAAAHAEPVQPSSSFGREWLSLFGRLALPVPSVFLAQENVEHLLAHGHVEGLAIYFGAGSELVLPVVLLVVASIAALGALVRWREVALIARLRAAGMGRARRPRSAIERAPGWDVTAALLRLRLLHVGRDLGRDPPLGTQA